MESWKAILALIGLMSILFGIIFFGFTKTVNEIIHSDEMVRHNATVSNISQTSQYHHGSRHSTGYTEYITTITFINDDKTSSDKTFTVEATSRDKYKYKYEIGTKVNVFELNGNYSLIEDSLYESKIFSKLGFGMIVIGLSLVLVPISGGRRSRYSFFR